MDTQSSDTGIVILWSITNCRPELQLALINRKCLKLTALMLFLPLILISNTQPSEMTRGHYPNDAGLLATVRVCQTPVAVPSYSSQGVYIA